MTAPESVIAGDEILQTLQSILKDILLLESVDSLGPEARFEEDLNLDSLGMVDVVIAIEEGFGVKLPSDVNIFEDVRTVGGAVALIRRLQAGAD